MANRAVEGVVTQVAQRLRTWIRVAMAAVLLAAVAGLTAVTGHASQSAQRAADAPPALLLGAAWYPEQWPESRWDKDLALMEEAHLRVVRMGEFAWSRMEPAEGQFDLDWLERAVRLAEKHHIAVVLGTPADAPPAWLTSKYPDTLRVDADGRRAQHGGRRQFNYASPRYRRFCAEIAGRLARRFGHDPDVIGWQIGNEYTDESFDDATRAQFQQWLRRQFGTLQALNEHWATTYWSQTYDRWDEIPMTAAGGNPGLELAYRHFVSDTWRSFQRVQIDAIRKWSDKRQFITTNLGGLGWSDHFDHYEMTRDLDLASWDDYVGEGHLKPARNGAMHDLVRGWKRKCFWVMETQPGYVNWAPVNTTLDRGETRAMAWQAIGHGADAVLYWQWRSALNGQEQYHGTLVGPDGEPMPVYTEVSRIGREFEKAAPAIRDTSPVAQVALLHSYDSRWAIDFQRHNRNYHQLDVLLDWYRPLRAQGLTVDIVTPDAPLDGYKLVVAPDLNVISSRLGARLLAYVEQGGQLVLGPRSGMKDEYNALNVQRQPGPLVTPLGGRVEAYYALENPVPVSGELGAGSASLWAEQLSTRAANASVLLRYGKSNGWLDGTPAMITRPVGKGRISYLGAVLDADLMRSAVAWMTQTAQVRAEFGQVPAKVEVCRRIGADHTVFILINHGSESATVHLPTPMIDVLRRQPAPTEVELAGQGVTVLEAQHSAPGADDKER
ncbi:MAG TPA: beta-galactosidase [Terracidiphilus sp.]|nr:beta-galactosidase [Terracidiphilus sp.]